MDAFIDSVNDLIGNPALTAMLVALVPLIELGRHLFAPAGLGFLAALAIHLGSTVVAVPIFFAQADFEPAQKSSGSTALPARWRSISEKRRRK
ncbi:MAG: hypothetical protein ACLUHK_00210 [Eubacteriales bacterium]